MCDSVSLVREQLICDSVSLLRELDFDRSYHGCDMTYQLQLQPQQTIASTRN
jgi:hypothetical protein